MMNLSSYPPDVQMYISGLIERGIINAEDPVDKTLISYLYGQKFDADYVKSMMNDRSKL